ncbi:MAG: hypothetical protein WCL33_07305 [Planctomycetota bacterium]
MVSPTAQWIDAPPVRDAGRPWVAPDETTLGHTTGSVAGTEACANIV